jgi:hypothetical protein
MCQLLLVKVTCVILPFVMLEKIVTLFSDSIGETVTS